MAFRLQESLVELDRIPIFGFFNRDYFLLLVLQEVLQYDPAALGVGLLPLLFFEIVRVLEALDCLVELVHVVIIHEL